MKDIINCFRNDGLFVQYKEEDVPTVLVKNDGETQNVVPGLLESIGIGDFTMTMESDFVEGVCVNSFLRIKLKDATRAKVYGRRI